MDRLIRLLAIAVVVAALPAAAVAQDADADAKAATERLIAGLSGFDETLLGTHWLGVYLNGAQNIGKVRLEVAKAPEGSSGAYLVKMEMTIKMGPQAFSQKQESILDEKLALVSSREENDLPTGRKSQIVRKDGPNWVCDLRWQNKGEAEESARTLTLGIDGPNYKEMVSGLLMLRKIDLSKEAEYLIPGVAWPALEKGETEEPKYVDVRTKLSAKQDHTHRGNVVKAVSVRVEDPSEGETTVIIIGENGGVLQISSEEAPLVMIAGTEEECGKSIEVKKSAVQGKPAKTPSEAVMTYFRVIAGEQDPEVLDAVMDWKAVRDDMGADKPEVAEMSVEVFASLVKSQFKKSAGAISPEQINAIEVLLQVEENGDEASVGIPGADKPFKLVKSDGNWKITYFPH